MKKLFFILLAVVYSFSAFAQIQGTRQLRAWNDGMIIWQIDAALVDSLNFFIHYNDSENNNGGGTMDNDSSQIFVGVVAFNKTVNQLPITTDIESAKSFITSQTNNQDFTAFAYSVSKGNQLFDAEGLPKFDKIFMLNFSDGTDNYSNMLYGMEGRMVGSAYVYDTARYDISQRAGLNSYAIGFGDDLGFGEKMRKVVRGSGEYRNAETSDDLQSTFTEIAQSIIASAKNVVLTTNPGFYSETMGYKYFRFTFTAENGLQDTIYAKMDGTPFMGFTLSITKAGKYASFDTPVQGSYDEEGTGKVLLPLNNLKFVSGDKDLQFTFDPYYSPDNTLFYTDVEEASTEESISKRIAVVLVLDCSKSMGDAFVPMKEAAIDFIESLEAIVPSIILSVNDETMGTVVGGGIYKKDEIATLTATANKGYQFVRWSDGVTTNPRTILVTERVSLTAEFEALSHTISAVVNDTIMGSVIGSGTYKTAEVATLTATANSGYRFVRWNDDVTIESRQITVTESLDLIAEFEALSHTITLSVNDTTMGTVTGAGIYKTAEIATLIAIPASCHRFVSWSDGVTTNPRTITVTGDSTLTANFTYSCINGHEYVDLGLPSGVLWATCNVGSDAPEECGSYFAWGETQPKDTNSYHNYSYTKTPSVLPYERDAASANWGSNWRMPTKAEFDELLAECTWTWTTNYNNTGKKGYIVQSKASNNTNSIFLPTAGYKEDTDISYTESHGQYWASSRCYSSYTYYGYYLDFSSSYQEVYFMDRHLGLTIRPVCSSTTDNDIQKYAITLSVNDSQMGTVTGEGAYLGGETATLTATPNDGYVFKRWSDGDVTNPRSITVTESLNLKAEFEIPYYTITVSVNDNTMGAVTGGGTYQATKIATLTATPNSGYAFKCWSDGITTNPREITVIEDTSLTAFFYSTFIDGHEFVDLGLTSGTLWATCNVGASTPEQYGNYFAWGETQTKNVYSTSTYTYGNNPTCLPLTNDVANVMWEGCWRMPTKAEYNELLIECYWSWTNNYNNTGRKGYIIQSMISGSTNHIFLPASGFCYESSLYYAGENGYYMSSSIGDDDPNSAYFLGFNSNSKEISATYRYCGVSVRPVCSAQ